jgi:SET domain-containing protein
VEAEQIVNAAVTTKKKLLANLEKVYCRVQASELHGVGVFAIRRIPKGVNPFEPPVPLELAQLTDIDIRALAPGLKRMVREYAVKQNGGYVLSTLGFNLLELEYFVNHSTSPNLAFDENAGCYRTARVIGRGEELTGDYNRFAPDMPAVPYRARKRR